MVSTEIQTLTSTIHFLHTNTVLDHMFSIGIQYNIICEEIFTLFF